MSTPMAALGNRTPEQLKVAELREELKKRGVQIKGLKKDLVDRLEEVLRQEEEEQIALEAATSEGAPASSELGEPELKSLVPENKLEEPETVSNSTVLPESLHDDSIVRTLFMSEGNGESEADLKLANPALKHRMEADPETDDQSNNGNGLSEFHDKPGVQDIPKQELEPGVVPGLDSGEVKSVEPAQEPISQFESLSEPVSSPAITSEIKVTPVELPELEVIPASVNLGLEERIDEDGDLPLKVEESPSAVVETGTGQDEVMECLKRDVSKVHEEEGLINEIECEEEKVLIEIEPMVEETAKLDAPREGPVKSKPMVEDRVKEEVPTEGPGESEPVVEESVVEDIPIEGPTEIKPAKADTPMEGERREEVMDVVMDPLDVEEWKVKAIQPMELDADLLAGSKRKDADAESRSQELTKRQRRWNTGKSLGSENDARPLPKIVTTDCPKETVAQEPKEMAPSPIAPSASAAASPRSGHAGGVERVTISRPSLSRTDTAVNGETDKALFVPPSLKVPTTSLKIDRFLRPFTFKAVKELLAQTGSVQHMWMDQIKTHCYVTYATVDEAVATRNALYNLQWPPQGGRLLTAEFVELEEVKSRCEGEKTVVAPVTTHHGLPETIRATSESGGPVPQPGHPPPLAPIPVSALPPPPPLPPPPRDRPPVPIKQDMEPQSPTLDDLFKKTRTKPHIYYLPVTEHDIAEKLLARSQTPLVKPVLKV